jgi:hypothetical protein
VWESEYIDPSFNDLGIVWRKVVNLKPCLLYPMGNDPRHPSDKRLGGPRIGLEDVVKI